MISSHLAAFVGRYSGFGFWLVSIHLAAFTELKTRISMFCVLIVQ